MRRQPVSWSLFVSTCQDIFFSYIKRTCKEIGTSIFSGRQVNDGRQQPQGARGKFKQDIWEKVFTVRVVQQWRKFPENAFLEGSHDSLGILPCTILQSLEVSLALGRGMD